MSETSLNGLIEAIERQYGPLPPLPPQPLCHLCRDRGCVACFPEREKREQEFEKHRQPVFEARRDDPEQMAELLQVAHADVIRADFSPGGGGVEAFNARAKKIMDARKIREAEKPKTRLVDVFELSDKMLTALTSRSFRTVEQVKEDVGDGNAADWLWSKAFMELDWEECVEFARIIKEQER